MGRLHWVGSLVLRRHLEHGRLDGELLLAWLQLILAGLNVLDRLASLLRARLRVRLDVNDTGSRVGAWHALLVHLARSHENGCRLLILVLTLSRLPGHDVHDQSYDAKDPASTVR